MICRGPSISEQKVLFENPLQSYKHPPLNIIPSSGIGRLTGRCLAFIQANPPESVQTDISLSQYLAIQEKGVSAWEFEPELEIANCFVEARTEIEFFDSECTVMSNLPVPKQNEVYYWEAKVYEKPENTLLSIGMTTKPYPLFRLPGLLHCSPVRRGSSPLIVSYSRISQVFGCLHLFRCAEI